MKLVQVELENYRRFAQSTKVDLVPRVLALIGPNEAGKSSLLSALPFLNQDQELDSSHRTRGEEGDVAITATFLLTPDDHEALKSVRGGPAIHRYTFECRLKGERTRYYYTLSPSPKRDLANRHKLAIRLRILVEQEGILGQFISVNNLVVDESYRKTIAILSSEADSLDRSQTQQMTQFVDAIHYFTKGKSTENPVIENNEISIELGELLEDLKNYDEGPSPSRKAADVLRVPFITLWERAGG